MKNILVLTRVTDHHKNLLEQSLPDAVFTYAAPKQVTDEQLSKANIILGNPKPEQLHGLTNLKLLQLHTAGSEQYEKEGTLPPDCRLCSASGAYGPAVSEHMLALTLSLCKKLHRYRDNQQQNLWKDEGEVLSVSELSILVIGAGDIGKHYARMCKALGAYTVGIRRKVSEPSSEFDELLAAEQLDFALPRADVVAMALPYTAQTHHFLDERRLKLMKPGALLINGGRGKTLDQQAALEALRSGRLGGIATDVCVPEPLPPESPLWQEKDFILTPHIAGLFHLPKTLDLVVDLAIRNIKRYSEENH